MLFFRRPILSTYEGTTPWLFKLLILACTIPTRLFCPCSHSLLYFFYLLKPEGFDSVSSLGFRDSFSAKLSRIWQIASRDSVTIFLFHVTCKRVFFPSDLPCTHFEKQKKLPDPKSIRTIRSIPRIARRRMQFASQCFSSAMLAGTFLKDSERMTILCSLASL